MTPGENAGRFHTSHALPHFCAASLKFEQKGDIINLPVEVFP
jgi:hypothetical protein